MQEPIVPTPGGSGQTGKLMLPPKPHIQLGPDHPIHFVKHPIAVPSPKIGAPPIQDRVELLDDIRQAVATGNRSDCLAHSFADVFLRFGARKHIDRLSRPSELKPKESEPLLDRRKSTLLMVDHKLEFSKLALELVPNLHCIGSCPYEKDHIIRVAHHSYWNLRLCQRGGPLTVNLVEKYIRK
jgi:hypothetical protein